MSSNDFMQSVKLGIPLHNSEVLHTYELRLRFLNFMIAKTDNFCIVGN
jgi:hypothetical protein